MVLICHVIVVTIGRVYSDRADRAAFRRMWEEIQAVVVRLTGKKFGLALLTEGCHLRSFGSDMDSAQCLALGDVLLKWNEPEFSKIYAKTAEEILPYGLKICHSHVKRFVVLICFICVSELILRPFCCVRGVHSLEGVLSTGEYQYIMNFPSLETDDEFETFKAFCSGHAEEKVRGMWRYSRFIVFFKRVETLCLIWMSIAWIKHKTDNPWILSGVIRSQTKMPLHYWDSTPSTTNGNEAQHAWTNKQTGTRLSLTEGVLSYVVLPVFYSLLAFPSFPDLLNS